MAGLKLMSTAFNDGEALPRRFTCQGEDVSPPLFWENTPPGTRSLAIVLEDLDAPTGSWCHWLAWDLSPHISLLPEAATGGLCEGTNDSRHVGYQGPCPPEGARHRYRFRLYALDRALNLRAGAPLATFEQAVTGHVIEVADLECVVGRIREPARGR